MSNTIFIETYSSQEEYKNNGKVLLPLESLVTYFVYKSCEPENVILNFVSTHRDSEIRPILAVSSKELNIIKQNDVPWQVNSCVYPVVMYEDTIITGLCAVARHICKYKSLKPNPQEHEEGLLGFRKSCLQAPNEVSIWTKFCEVDVIKTTTQVLLKEFLNEVPKNLVRFENHLKKPVRVHNVYKIAREIKKDNLINVISDKATLVPEPESIKNADTSRTPKTRKWKSNTKKELEIDCSVKIEDLDINHQFAEGPFLTLADLVLLPCYHIIVKCFGQDNFQALLPVTYKWYKTLISLGELTTLLDIFEEEQFQISVSSKKLALPSTEDVSLYKCDPKRHNPKKRLFTKEDDIQKALSSVTSEMEISIGDNSFEVDFNWDDIPDGANPLAGHLPDERMLRKSQQLQNLALAVLKIAKEGDLIVDFCSGSGHLGILIAHLLPKCTVILLENKEQSLLRARARIHEMGLSNVYFFQCNLDFFIGKFDIGIALHACGIASDLVLDKCLKANAKFVICPCCYGSLHATDRLVYPRSGVFSTVPVDQYLCIGHTADQTHEEHPLAVRGARCMAIIDSDRGRLAQELGYQVSLSRLKPLSCTPKNNLLIGVPS